MDGEANRHHFGGRQLRAFGIGVGLAVASWGTSVGWSILSGLFWPVTVAYWLMQALHKAAGG